jgi:type IV pilus assembly protein PilO
MKKDIPTAPILAVALVVVALVGYFFLVKPKQDSAGQLDAQAADLQAQVDTALAAKDHGNDQGPTQDETAIKVADLFRLTRAMPKETDMPGIIVELDSVAAAAGIDFNSVAPQAPTVRSTYTALPISLTFTGNFYDLTDFLFRVRNLVQVRDGQLVSDGRLFTLDSLDLQEGPDGFPQITAALTLTAFVYSTDTAAAPTGTATPPAATTPPATTTAPATSTQPTGSAAPAGSAG